MLFNSTLYFTFLVFVVVLYYGLTPTYRRILLLLADYAFYWVWSVPFSLLLVASTLVDYLAARWIAAAESSWQRRLGLALSVAFNLGTLALFKYADFFSESAYALTGERPWPELSLILPLGISFYTFQTMSYTLDVYRGLIPARKSFLDVALYVSFFPQLVAGPILRAGTLIPQLRCIDGSVDWTGIRRGVALILWGLCKKVYVADTMGRLVNEAYRAPELFGGMDLLLATYGFAVQIYCDFSGYSDIAIGSALLIGIKLPENFDKPYLSCSIQEFWRRWHISLSTWLRDYLYIPLGGNRHGRVRRYINLMITMLLGGLWHGAGWNWVVWGALHGALLSIERAVGLPEKARGRVEAFVRWFLTIHLVCLTWVFFRADGIDQAAMILIRILGGAEGVLSLGLEPVICLAVILLVERLDLRRRWLGAFVGQPVLARWVTYAAFVLLSLTFMGSSNPEFIYFQF